MENETLHERLTLYLENCQATKARFQAWSEAHERSAEQAYKGRRDRDVRDHTRQSHFYAAQACAYRDVITNLERLLGVTR